MDGHGDRELELGRFGEYLLRNRLVEERHARYCVTWVRKFLAWAPGAAAGLSLEDRLKGFLHAQAGKMLDWQADQAERAIRLYYVNFLKNPELTNPRASNVEPSADGRFVKGVVVDAARNLMRLRHYSYRTEQTYLDWVTRFFAYLDERAGVADGTPHPVSAAELRDFLAYLAVRKTVAASTQNQAFSALLFMSQEVLHLDLGDLSDSVRAKRGTKLPVVLTVEEVRAVLDAMEGTTKLMAELIYGGGLRVMECCRLRIKDIDFENNLVFVRAGKGDKDRSTILPEKVKPVLKAHMERVRALHQQDLAAGVGEVWLPFALDRKYPEAPKEWGWQYVFPSKGLSNDPRSDKVRRHHVTDNMIQTALRAAVKKAGITKPASVHTLRHSFATTLLLNNTDIRQIQTYLGHEQVETTMIYTHVVKDMRKPAVSPLDML